MNYEMEIFGVVVSTFILTIICICGLEVRSYLRKKTIIDRNHLILRMIGACVIMILLVKVLYGIQWVDHHLQGTEYFIKYWSHCSVLAFVSFLFACVDMWLVMRLRRNVGSVDSRIAFKLNKIYRSYLSTRSN